MVTFTLYKKEMLASWRSAKWLWLPIVFAILGALQPLTIYYMPEILSIAGGLSEGVVIEMPTPTGDEVMAGVLNQYNMLGIVIIIAASMGIINSERQRQTLSLVMTRPVSAFEYIVSKWVAELTIIFIALAFGYGLSIYYTAVLFDNLTYINLVKSFFVYFVWISFVVTIILLLSTLFTNNGAIIGVGILIAGTLSLLDGLITKFMKWSPSLLATESYNLLLENKFTNSFSVTLTSSIIIIAIILFATIFIFKRQDYC